MKWAWRAFAAIIIPWLGAGWPLLAQDVRIDSAPGAAANRQLAMAVDQMRRAAGLLGLERWVVIVQLDSLGPSALARVSSDRIHQTAVVRLDSLNLPRTPRRDLCRMAIHEGLHVRLAPLRAALYAFWQAAQADSLQWWQATMIEEEVVTGLERLAIWKCP